MVLNETPILVNSTSETDSGDNEADDECDRVDTEDLLSSPIPSPPHKGPLEPEAVQNCSQREPPPLTLLDQLDTSESDENTAEENVPSRQMEHEMDLSEPIDNSSKVKTIAIDVTAPGYQAFKEQWSCINATINNKIHRSKQNTADNLTRFIMGKLGDRSVTSISQESWAIWIIQWAIPRGKCTYADKSKGISPQSAAIYFKMLKRVLLKHFNFNLIEAYPSMYHFPMKWQETIARDKLYVRKQAGYFTRDDVRQYLLMFQTFIDGGSTKQSYFARMGRCILPIAILFAGCRLGELFSARVGQVQFVTVRGKVAVAIHSTGTKSDLANQRSSPIIFGELDQTDIDPTRTFMQWLQFRNWQVQPDGIQAPKNALLFPSFKDDKVKLPTAIFTREIRDLEIKSRPDAIPRFKAHSGRFTITTLALFGKDSKDQPLISPLMLEHQLHWVRNTSTLSNYLGHNASFVKGGFYNQIQKMRNEGADTKLDEQSITAFNLRHIDTVHFMDWYKSTIQ